MGYKFKRNFNYFNVLNSVFISEMSVCTLLKVSDETYYVVITICK